MSKKIIDIINDPSGLRLFQQEGAILEFTELVCELLERTKTSRTELAKSLKMPKQRLNAILAGGVDITIREMADIFTSLNHELGFNIRSSSRFT